MATENRTPDDLQEAVAATLRRLRGEVRDPAPAAPTASSPSLSGLTAPQEAPAPPLTSEESAGRARSALAAASLKFRRRRRERSACRKAPAAYREEVSRAAGRAGLPMRCPSPRWSFSPASSGGPIKLSWPGHKNGPVPDDHRRYNPAQDAAQPTRPTTDARGQRKNGVRPDLRHQHAAEDRSAAARAGDAPDLRRRRRHRFPRATDTAGTATDDRAARRPTARPRPRP